MRLLTVALAAFFLAHAAPAAFAADVPTPGAPYYDGPSARFTLGGHWYLKRDPTIAGTAQGWQRTTDFGGWTPVTVPNAFNAGDASENSYTGSVVWYGTEFVRPRAPRGARWVLHFDSVNYSATVWVNGRKIGSHGGGYVPFELDAGALKSGVNRVVVRVDSRLSETTVPSQEVRNDQLTGGWWNYGGILRGVILRRVGALDISSAAARSSFKSTRGPARITVVANVRNFSRRKRVRIRLRGRFGKVAVRFRPVVMRRGNSAELIGTAVVRRPKLWQPLAPNLYNVSVSGPGATYRFESGIRRLSVSRSGGLSLNGRSVRLRGVSFHEADVVHGAAWDAATRDAHLALIARLGANMIRTHYPLDPSIMQWADRNGVLVWTQAPVFRARESQLNSSRYRAAAVSFTRQMVTQYRAHPSVLVWSLLNEAVPSGTANLNKLVTAQRAVVRKLDPSGLIGADYAAAPEDELQHPAYRKLDVLGVNEYFGWYPGLLGSTLSLAQLRPYLDYLNKTYSHQALFVTEFGAEANRSGSADELGTYEFQAKYMVDQMRILRAIPYLNGFFAWALKDYWVRPDWTGGNPDPSPPLSTKGLFDAAGNAKPAEAEVEREFTATPPFR